jgi:hypothetical protein
MGASALAKLMPDPPKVSRVAYSTVKNTDTKLSVFILINTG